MHLIKSDAYDCRLANSRFFLCVCACVCMWCVCVCVCVCDVWCVCRILFPILSRDDKNMTNSGCPCMWGDDPDDYVAIDSGYELLHPLVFRRLFTVLINLYVLYHEDRDRRYQRGLNRLNTMSCEELVRFVRFPP